VVFLQGPKASKAPKTASLHFLSGSDLTVAWKAARCFQCTGPCECGEPDTLAHRSSRCDGSGPLDEENFENKWTALTEAFFRQRTVPVPLEPEARFFDGNGDTTCAI
jgi:hypothetical protein